MSIPLEKKTTNLSGTVYERLKAAIVHWEYRPGSRLPAEAVAKRLGVSRTPVREALRRLEQEKLVSYEPQRGYSTRSIELREFNELYEVRVVLEKFAVAQAIEAMDVPQSREMLEDLRQTWVMRVAQPPDTEAIDQLDDDEAFHESIALASENRYLHELLQSINERIRSIRLVDFHYPERIKTTYAEHLDVIEAITKRDSCHAIEAIERHILNSQTKVRENAMQALFQAYG